MVKINCEHFEEPILLNAEKETILRVDHPTVLAKIVYALCQEDDEYLRIYDDHFQMIKNKDVLTILNPLLIDLEDKTFKTLFYNKVFAEINVNIEKKQMLENDYQKIVLQLTECIDACVNFEYQVEMTMDFKEFFKGMKLTINPNGCHSVFEKVACILQILFELDCKQLIIFTLLSNFLTEEEFKIILEQIRLNKQTVLFIEGQVFSYKQILYYHLDSDFFLQQTMIE